MAVNDHIMNTLKVLAIHDPPYGYKEQWLLFRIQS